MADSATDPSQNHDEPSGAVAAALAWLRQRDAAESAIAAHETDTADSADEARRWTRWVLNNERDGAWGESLNDTVQALLTLRELRQAAGLRELDPAIGRGLDWVRGRRGRPGAWTDGCDPERHRLRVCHHFAGGFYSPGMAPLADLRLSTGVRAAGDPEARFAVSAEALRCTLLWRGAGTDDRNHLAALRHVVRRWDWAIPSGLTTTGLLSAIRSLLASGRDEDRSAAAHGLVWVAGRQRGDGSWPDTDPVHAMAAFLDAVAAGVDEPRVTDALGHGARLLGAAQREDGSWGPDEHGARRALIAVRTLRAAETSRSGP